MSRILFFTILTCSVPAAAAPKVTRSDACKGAAGFDYWVGDWEVHPTAAPDKATMANLITLEQDGCVVQEHWRGQGGYTGTSFTVYDTARGVWHQTRVDNAGGLAVMEGGLDEKGELVLKRLPLPADKDTAVRRMSYRRQPDGSVRQLVERSEDGGATWVTKIDLTYRRRAAAH
jgi:hypothetical protein